MNIFNAPLPGTTLRNITEEWKVLSGFHALMQQRMELESEHLRQLRQFQDSIDPTWSKSGVWALISPVVELWSSQMNIMEECGNVLAGIVEACPTQPSPDAPEEAIIPYSRYDLLHGSYKAYRDCQTAASSREAIAEMRKWFTRSHYTSELLPAIDMSYRRSVVVQRDTLRPIVEWHSTSLPKKLETHVGYAEKTQTCLRDYSAEFSKSTAELVKSISTAQKRLAEFSSLAFIDPSQKLFENEASHPALQKAVYLSHYLGGVPAEPVLGVLSYLPELMEVGEGDGRFYMGLSAGRFLELEKESTSFEETTQQLKANVQFYQSELTLLALNAIGPLLPIGEGAIQRYKNGIQRSEIAQLLKPSPIENCQMAATMIKKSVNFNPDFFYWTRLIFGSSAAYQLLENIWRKWDFENHRPLPREVVRTPLRWNDRTYKVEGGELIIKKTGLPYDPLK